MKDLQLDCKRLVHKYTAALVLMGPVQSSFSHFSVLQTRPSNTSCPCTVINAELCDHLGLHWHLLPMSKNNLLSLSHMLLNCEEYIELELHLGKGTWKVGVHKMKENKGLPFPVILGMPWLSSEKILIDSHEWMAIDKCTGYDILNPPHPDRSGPHVSADNSTTNSKENPSHQTTHSWGDRNTCTGRLPPPGSYHGRSLHSPP